MLKQQLAESGTSNVRTPLSTLINYDTCDEILIFNAAFR